MPKSASVSPIRASARKRHPRFEISGSHKPPDFLASAKGRLLLEMLCHSLPLGALVLDAQCRMVFANSEALHVVSLWRSAGAHASATKNRFDAPVPSEILAACNHLKQEFIKRSNSRAANRPNFAARVRVKHPQRPRLSAVVSLERSRRDRAVAGFCVLLQDGLTWNVVGGRGDQLALLTPAERHVAKMVANGLRNEEVAASLGKSVGTVKAQLRSIFGKLDVRTRTQLVSLLRSLE